LRISSARFTMGMLCSSARPGDAPIGADFTGSVFTNKGT
jgi:hypothetical protein